MRLLTLALLALLVLIQYPLWLGKGGWMRVWEVDRQLVTQNKANERLVERNRALEGEVRDLQQGTGRSKSAPVMNWVSCAATRSLCSSWIRPLRRLCRCALPALRRQ